MKNPSEKRFVVTLAITTLTLTAFSFPAKAGDNKVYSGSACLPVSAESASLLRRTRERTLSPPSGQANVSLVCPIVRDKTGGGSTSSFIDVTGAVRIDRCVLNTYSANGTLVASIQDSDDNFTSVGNGIRRIDIKNTPQIPQ